MAKLLFIDVETTGLDCKINDIISLGLIIEINGVIKERHDIYMQPFNWDALDKEALEVNNFTRKQIKDFAHPRAVYPVLCEMFSKYVNKYSPEDKYTPCGYNVAFDLNFLSEFWNKNEDKYLGSFIDWRQKLDPMFILSVMQYKGFIKVENLKLVTVCEYFNIPLPDAHNALADITATRLLLDKVLGYIRQPNDVSIDITSPNGNIWIEGNKDSVIFHDHSKEEMEEYTWLELYEMVKS